MSGSGIELERLTRRLADTPGDFLAVPRTGVDGQLHVAALVNDVAARLGGRLPAAELARFTDGDANFLSVAAILAWLLADEAFATAAPARQALTGLLGSAAAELAHTTKAVRFVTDPERREELARVALARLELLPAGETPTQATDRLAAISGPERRRLIEAARAAEIRAGQIRKALARKAAEEAADKWSRE